MRWWIRLTTLAVVSVIGLGSISTATAAPFEIRNHDRVAFVGNSLAERMRLYGHFETMLQLRFPKSHIAVRNFGWPADAVERQQRPNDYTKLDDPLKVFGPDVVVCFFGYNESFAGADGLPAFRTNLKKYIDRTRQELAKDGTPPRLVLVSPIAHENTGDPHLPDGQQENANLKLYTAAMREMASELEVRFVDLLTPTLPVFAEKPGAQYTINGAHLNEQGDRVLAGLLQDSLFASPAPGLEETARYEAIRRAVIDKEWHHQQDYRMVNGWYVYGGRNSPFGVINFPEEYKKIRRMVAIRDQRIWDIALDKPVSLEVDDRDTGELKPIPTTFGTKAYSEPEELRFLSPTDALEAMTVADGYRVQTFASEEMFPELANPVQMNFDNRGRLWAACMPTYPQWRPGDPKPNDRLLIFEDTDGDGVADECKVFADDLHIPTGFEFWNGGVLVTSQPSLVFLKDTNGDDRADVHEVLFDGFATDDTHHAIGAFEWSPNGELIMLEGIALSTAVETPWGPFRNLNRSVAYRLDPRTWKIDRQMTPCYANPWCYTHNDWGQAFVGDGTGADQYWATPLTGQPYPGRKGTQQFIRYDGPRMRPALGNEFIYSRQFPDSAQGNFIYACVINMNGILQFHVEEQDSGYLGTRVDDLVTSTDRNFRPADPQIGPDGALYFGDWHNPLIGHMQYSQRDPNRDHRHGRIYRLSAKDRPPIAPVTQAGKSIAELLEQFREYESRTRYRVRRELRDRKTEDVLEGINKWVAQLDSQDPQYDRLLTEALWVEQAHHAVQPELLDLVLSAHTADARAAATHVVAGERDNIPDALDRLAVMVNDPHPRVRLEAVRGVSFFPTLQAVEIALQAVNHEMDYYLTYTLNSTLGALRPVWESPLKSGTPFAAENLRGLVYLKNMASTKKYGTAAVALLTSFGETPAGEVARKQEAIGKIAELQGDVSEGEKVFKRICIACHMIDQAGAKFGPNLSDVGKRLKRPEIVESILDPNAKVDPKYRTVNVITVEGKVYSGLLVEDTTESITLHVGANKTQVVAKDDIDEIVKLNVSSMPERLHETMAGEEFVDLLQFLAAQQKPPQPEPVKQQ